MSMQRQHSPPPGGPSRLLGLAAALLICAGLAACTAAGPPTSAATAPAERCRAAAVEDADLDAGTYLFDSFTVPFEITVPDGWTYVDDRVLRKDVGDTEGALRLVRPRHPRPGGRLRVARHARRGRTLGRGIRRRARGAGIDDDDRSHRGDGRRLQRRRVRLRRGGDVDIERCSGDKICIHSEYRSCTRWYNSSVAQRETYRVLDLDGERAILTVGEFDDETDPALVEEARAVFDSITFVPDE